MSGVLAGQVALVTGAGAGIGEGIARRFAQEGARVVVAEFDRSTGQTVADAIGGKFIETDASDREQIEAAVAATVTEFGAVDIVVNNAWSGGGIGRMENKTDEAIAHGIASGYYGPFWAMRAAYPHMGSLEYNGAKEALRALTRTAAREWAPTGVTVNAICPAAKSKAFLSVIAQYPELEKVADAANPMGRMGDPLDDIAPVAVFLASEASCYLTGNTLFVDGGAHINGVAWAPDLDAQA